MAPLSHWRPSSFLCSLTHLGYVPGMRAKVYGGHTPFSHQSFISFELCSHFTVLLAHPTKEAHITFPIYLNSTALKGTLLWENQIILWQACISPGLMLTFHP